MDEEMFDNDAEDTEDIIILTDEDGNDYEFEWIDSIAVKDNRYIVVLPVEEEPADEVLILKFCIEEEAFVPIEDKSESDNIFELFMERNKEYYDFTD